MSPSLILAVSVAALFAGSFCVAAASGRIGFLPVAAVNERSLHQRPVRTSGGLAIIGGLLAAWLAQWIATGQAGLWPVMLGAAVLATIGWKDDRDGIAAWIRLGSEAAVAAAILISFGGGELLLSPTGLAILIGMLWFINLFNFMDGSDGLAASQTVIGMIPLLAAGALGFATGSAETDATAIALAGACLAFLVFNRPPARLFMGDAGSLSIPLVVAGIAIASPDPVSAGLTILIGFAGFVADASLTLAIRMLAGERWWAAHRSHAYQLVIRRTGSHAAPLAALWAYGLLWLAPVALFAASGRLGAAEALAAAYAPVLCGCAFIQWRYRRALAG